MKYYAIREKATGFFLPQSDRTVRAGHTHMEPRDPKICPPRLFTKEGPAKCALTWWLKGITDEDFGYDEDWRGNEYKYSEGPSNPRPGTARNPESMEIVAITLMPLENTNATQ